METYLREGISLAYLIARSPVADNASNAENLCWGSLEELVVG